MFLEREIPHFRHELVDVNGDCGVIFLFGTDVEPVLVEERRLLLGMVHSYCLAVVEVPGSEIFRGAKEHFAFSADNLKN